MLKELISHCILAVAIGPTMVLPRKATGIFHQRARRMPIKHVFSKISGAGSYRTHGTAITVLSLPTDRQVCLARLLPFFSSLLSMPLGFLIQQRSILLISLKSLFVWHRQREELFDGWLWRKQRFDSPQERIAAAPRAGSSLVCHLQFRTLGMSDVAFATQGSFQ